MKSIILLIITTMLCYSYTNEDTLKIKNTINTNYESPFFQQLIFGSLGGSTGGFLSGMGVAGISTMFISDSWGKLGVAVIGFGAGYLFGHILISSIITYNVGNNYYSKSSGSIYLWDLFGTFIGFSIPATLAILTFVEYHFYMNRDIILIASMLLSTFLPTLGGVLGYEIGRSLENNIKYRTVLIKWNNNINEIKHEFNYVFIRI